MKTAHGKLALLAFILVLAALLFAPMRAGMEDALQISPEVLKMSVGGNYQLKCMLQSDDKDQSVRFESSNDRVASVRPDGMVYAMNSGEAVISAYASGGAEAQMLVYVDGTPMHSLQLNVDYLELGKGEFSGLKAIYNEDASDTRLQWISSDETIAKVNQYGRIEGVGGGECVVSALAPNGLSASARVLVDVEGTAVHVFPNDLTVGVGAEVQLKTVHLPADSTDHVVSWISSNPGCAFVDADKVLHAVGVGDAIISAKTEDGASAVINVSVETAPRDLQLTPNRATISRGDTLDMQLRFLKADGEPDNSVDHLVVWNSSDESVATVDQNGRVTAIKSGDTRITATSDGMVASCRLKVEVFVKQLTLDREEVHLLREDTAEPIQLKWSIAPADADDKTITFTSSNEQVATVDANGLVMLTGGYGSVTITAEAASGAQDTFDIHVVTQLPTPEPTAEPTPEPASMDGILDENGDIGFAGEDEDDEFDFTSEDFSFADEDDDTDGFAGSDITENAEDAYISTGMYPWEKTPVYTPAAPSQPGAEDASGNAAAEAPTSTAAPQALYPWEQGGSQPAAESAPAANANGGTAASQALYPWEQGGSQPAATAVVTPEPTAEATPEPTPEPTKQVSAVG